MSSKTSKTDAEVKFARTQKRATDALRATNDAVAEAKRIDDNTARLRALRLARDAKEAADRANGIVAAPAGKAKAKAADLKAVPSAGAKTMSSKTAPGKPAKAAAAKPGMEQPAGDKATSARAKPKSIPAKKLSARNDG